jgi:hypothetical protein
MTYIFSVVAESANLPETRIAEAAVQDVAPHRARQGTERAGSRRSRPPPGRSSTRIWTPTFRRAEAIKEEADPFKYLLTCYL